MLHESLLADLKISCDFEPKSYNRFTFLIHNGKLVISINEKVITILNLPAKRQVPSLTVQKENSARLKRTSSNKNEAYEILAASSLPTTNNIKF